MRELWTIGVPDLKKETSPPGAVGTVGRGRLAVLLGAVCCDPGTVCWNSEASPQMDVRGGPARAPAPAPAPAPPAASRVLTARRGPRPGPPRSPPSLGEARPGPSGLSHPGRQSSGTDLQPRSRRVGKRPPRAPGSERRGSGREGAEGPDLGLHPRGSTPAAGEEENRGPGRAERAWGGH
jgi:hypothetical protein